MQALATAQVFTRGRARTFNARSSCLLARGARSARAAAAPALCRAVTLGGAPARGLGPGTLPAPAPS
eukprot:13013600-Alexandrium_andersonii.AAC.1